MIIIAKLPARRGTGQRLRAALLQPRSTPDFGVGGGGSVGFPADQLMERGLSAAQMLFDRSDDPRAPVFGQGFEPGEHFADLTG